MTTSILFRRNAPKLFQASCASIFSNKLTVVRRLLGRFLLILLSQMSWKNNHQLWMQMPLPPLLKLKSLPKSLLRHFYFLPRPNFSIVNTLTVASGKGQSSGTDAPSQGLTRDDLGTNASSSNVFALQSYLFSSAILHVQRDTRGEYGKGLPRYSGLVGRHGNVTSAGWPWRGGGREREGETRSTRHAP